MKPLLRRRDERGETLIEVLVTIAILAIAVVAVVGGLGTAVFMSDTHSKEATEQTVIHDYAEAVQGYQTWKGCSATTSTYSPGSVGFSAYNPAVYTVTVTSVQYWNGSTFSSSCGADTGLQKISLQVASPPRATETLTVIKRCPGPRTGAGGSCP